MFSPEDVLFYKLMLESGCPELLDEALDAALKEEDPLSEVVLDLAYSGEDENARLSALNKYLENVPDNKIDVDAVVDRIFGLFIEKYESIDKSEGYLKSIDGFMALMWSTYCSASEVRCLEGNFLINWFSALSDYYELTEEGIPYGEPGDGIIGESAFRESLEALLYKRERVSPWRPDPPKRGLIDMIRSLFSKRT